MAKNFFCREKAQEAQKDFRVLRLLCIFAANHFVLLYPSSASSAASCKNEYRLFRWTDE